MRMFKIEEEKELVREDKLRNCSNDEEKENLEKKFGIERAQAKENIQKFSL